MEIGKQIQYYRKRDGLTQEDLAEKVYVSRNSVSNWERGNNYPDIEMLLRMSILFDVTIDHLVKGDVKEMKNEIHLMRFNQWSTIMLISFGALALLIIPSFRYFDMYGFLVLLPFAGAGLYAGYRTEKYKKSIIHNHNLKTYEQILNYIESDGENMDAEYKYHRPKHSISISIFCIAYFLLLYLSVKLFL
ncbi:MULTISPECIES: helix-turn-helix domain-containing protein [Oceanobacillus]|uniref:HTH-type transcriptional regulator ImmR n=2 Tax=Oceanobacillus TaxID=182709 RepID=A0A0A1M8G0_9BACI|nr:helix-turn-helix transcriptional regulator [Oceanobacillus oncorhynchi]MDM8102220.1 helix-turn-helix transcriptional regulator [Oceanobacillus oncorhynchi]CEI81625.1 HTH-type transcriptional regulator ImmR [Oceanobacillus oncorhynchi]